jgi:hypothetical protein
MEGGIMSETRVKVDLSFTRNLGNYESIRINVGVEDDVRKGENVETATERVYAFVENKLIEKTREVEKELNSGK